MNKTIIPVILFAFASSQTVGAKLSSADISAKIAVMDKVSLDCIAALRQKGLPSEGKVWVACDRYEGRLHEFNKIMKSSPSLSEEDEKKVGYIKMRQPLIKEFSKY